MNGTTWLTGGTYSPPAALAGGLVWHGVVVPAEAVEFVCNILRTVDASLNAETVVEDIALDLVGTQPLEVDLDMEMARELVLFIAQTVGIEVGIRRAIDFELTPED
jgi:hypothetical protein